MEESKMTEQKWVQEAADKIKCKMRIVAERSRHKIPYTTKEGIHDDCSGERVGWRTNGFWGGIMWQLYHATGEELYREIALENEKKLDVVLMMPRDYGP